MIILAGRGQTKLDMNAYSRNFRKSKCEFANSPTWRNRVIRMAKLLPEKYTHKPDRVYKRNIFSLVENNIWQIPQWNCFVTKSNTGWFKKPYQLRLKSAIFHVMSWKFGFNIIRGCRIRIWNRILDISIPRAPKLR